MINNIIVFLHQHEKALELFTGRCRVEGVGHHQQSFRGVALAALRSRGGGGNQMNQINNLDTDKQ